MPSEYDAASASRDARRRRRAPTPAPAARPEPLSAWPTMIDETIGSIGSTHGVSESSRPAMKNAPTIGQNEPPRSTASIAGRFAAAVGGAAALVASDGPPRRRRPAARRAPCRRRRSRSGRRRRALHRRIAQARVGAALAGDDAGGTRRRPARPERRIVTRVAIGLDVLLEGLVELDLAGRDGRRAERRRRRPRT